MHCLERQIELCCEGGVFLKIFLGEDRGSVFSG